MPDRWGAFSLVGGLTGLRWGEIASLEWSDFDFDQGKVNARRTTPAGTKGLQDPKSLTSHRAIDLLWPVRQALLDLPQRGKELSPLGTQKNLGPANGFEPLTYALRVRLLPIPHNLRSLRSLNIRRITALLRRKGVSGIPDGGERAPRVAQRKDSRETAGHQANYAGSGAGFVAHPHIRVIIDDDKLL